MVPGRPITSEHSRNPLRLKETLIAHDIQYSDLRTQLVRETGAGIGQPITNCDMSQLLNRGWMPATIPDATVRAMTERYLRLRGVGAEAIAGIWHRVLDETPPKVRHKDDLPPHVPARELRARAKREAEQEAHIDLPENEMLTPAARHHFKIVAHPFLADVSQSSDVFMSADQRYVRESMWYAAKHGGILAVVGESGSGKSTLRRDVEERVRRDNEPLRIIKPRTVDKKVLTTRHICDAIVGDLSSETPKATLEGKARQCERLLADSARAGVMHILMIEEAHDLSNDVLRYLKRFWEIEDGYRKLLSILLIGQLELLDVLDERKNYGVREFIRRCEIARLAPLDGQLEPYLAHKFKRVGVELSDVFDADAFDAIRVRLTLRKRTGEIESQVYPQIVQNLIVRAMNQAVDLGFPKINAKLIESI